MSEIGVAGHEQDESPQVRQAARAGTLTPMTMDGRKASAWEPGSYGKGGATNSD